MFTTWMLLLVLVYATLLSGCSSSDLVDTPTVDHAPPTPTADRAGSDAAEAEASADGGLAARVTLRAGEPQPASDVADEGVQSCMVLLKTLGQSEATAVPITVTGQVTSGGPTDLVVHLGNVSQIQDGSPRSGFANVLWAVTYSDVPAQCDHDLDSGTVRWSAASAGEHSWSTWAVVPGGEEAAGQMVLHPAVSLGGGLGSASFKFTKPSRYVLQCGDDEYSDEPAFYFALIPDQAVEDGCATASGAHATPITDRICNAQYPNASSTSDGAVTTYTREGSLAQTCEGFGAPEDLHLTPGMRCALIAAGATFGAADVSLPTDHLCQAAGIADSYRTGGWLSEAAGDGCDYLGAVFAGGVGIVVAGATSESGPGAVAVGVGTYKALSAALKVACGGLFAGGAQSFGAWLEARHETHVAVDVERHGKCLQIDRRHGTTFRAVGCMG
jgi:hypothetical protein